MSVPTSVRARAQWLEGVLASYLRFHQSIDDGLQRLVEIALENTLKVVGPVLQSFRHRHIEVVVGLFCRQILEGGGCA